MNAAAFRHFYGYHFFQNREIWDQYVVALSQEQFTREVGYSHGSVRNQLVHLMSADNTWFCELRGVEIPDNFDPAAFDDRALLRARWDEVEQMQRDYLAQLRDDLLFAKPFPAGEDQDLIVWQVLIHAVNHGTDHRAQLLRQLNDMGVKTQWQDYIFYVYDHPMP